MGLLPEIERSWVTVDHRLLLWDWADGSSFSTFESLTDVIVGVALVTPKPGVFVDTISHLLVLATPTEVSLVGLGYAPPKDQPAAKKEVTFYMTGLSAPTDGVSFINIKGTSSGRIFLASSADALTPGGIGGDGCLYELAYQRAEGWFAKKCSLHNLTNGGITKSIVPSFLRSLSAVADKDWIVDLQVDRERGLLYTLLRNGAIEMYQLPTTGPGQTFDGPPNKVARAGDVVRQAQAMVPNSPMLRSFKLASLEVISVREAGNGKVALVAVTTTGVRLYFTHQRRGYSYYSVSATPATLDLCHVRPPPTPSSQQPPPPALSYYGQPAPVPAPPAQPTIAFNAVIQAKYSSGGLLIAANNLNQDVDVLFVASPDVAATARASAEAVAGTNASGAATRPFSEVAGTIEVAGRTWDIVEITPKALSSPAGATALNELATQATQPRREWVVLTNMGANVVSRQRPLDTLLDVLQSAGMNGSGGHGEVGVFFESYGRDQSCAMLLAIAAGNSRVSLADAPVGASSGFGAGSNRATSSGAAEQAKALFFEGGGRPVSVDRGGPYGTQPQASADSKVIFSGRHEGLAFYFSRLVRPVWKANVTKPGPAGTQVAGISEAVLTAVQRDLISLRGFVEQEQSLFTALPDGHARSPQVAGAYQAEQASLAALRLLLNQSVEAISFLLLLIDYKMADLVAGCAPELQKQLAALTFQQLLASKPGRDVARGLVSAVINQQIGRQLSVDAVSDTLQQRCGSFCSADDVLLYKAIEAIRRAKDTNDPAERLDALRESLRLFSKAAGHLSLERLREVCGEYNGMGYPLGVIDLAIHCAKEWDAGERAVSFWLDGQPANDPRQVAYELRQACHALVFDALARADQALDVAFKLASTRAASGYEEADGLRTNAYGKALSVKDEFFHCALYDWYLARGTTDQLLEARTPFLEGYLSREPHTLEKSDLLWQLFVRTGRYADAAHVLAVLADTSAFPLSIPKRVEYLSLAVGNAKSQLPSALAGGSVQFLTEVEEKLEVAQVQIEVYRAIEELLELGPDERRAWLDRCEDRLLTISELYAEFAVPLGLLEIVLLIMHVSDHRDGALVLQTWEAILAKVQEQHPAGGGAQLDALEAKVVALARRFHTSDVAFPLSPLVALLERYSLTHGADARAGWVPLALRAAGVAFEAVFAAFEELLASRVPPFHTPAAGVFLAADLVSMLEAWLAEDARNVGYGGGGAGQQGGLPAGQVDGLVSKVVVAIAGAEGGEAVRRRLEDVQREVRRRF